MTRNLWLPLHIARRAVGKVRPGGTLLFMGGTGGRRPAAGPLIVAFTAAMPALIKIARARDRTCPRQPYRAPASSTRRCRHRCSATQLDARREQLRKTLPIRRVVGPADIAALAVHLMTNTAITGATYDIDGGQQLVEG